MLLHLKTASLIPGMAPQQQKICIAVFITGLELQSIHPKKEEWLLEWYAVSITAYEILAR